MNMLLLLEYLIRSTTMTYDYLSGSDKYFTVLYAYTQIQRILKLGKITLLNTNIESYKALNNSKDIFANKIDGAQEFFTKLDHFLSSVEDKKDSLWVVEKCLEYCCSNKFIFAISSGFCIDSIMQIRFLGSTFDQNEELAQKYKQLEPKFHGLLQQSHHDEVLKEVSGEVVDEIVLDANTTLVGDINMAGNLIADQAF